MAHKINEKNPTGNLTRWPAGLNLDAAEETRKLDPESRANFRSRGDKINIYVIRGTRQQRELLKHAAEKENTSMQKLIWDHLIRELEEKYGADLPLNNL